MKNPEIINWTLVRQSLDSQGYAVVASLLSEADCSRIRDLYAEEQLFRTTIDMQRYRFGRGEYKYFSYPLPSIVQTVRELVYPHLVLLANEWMKHLNIPVEYPEDLEAFLLKCRASDQKRPTPLILRYEPGGYNTLHQDIYGEVFFPFQLVVMLGRAGQDFAGGELVFVEQIPRAQSRAAVVSPSVGGAVIFTTNFRPVKGSKGYYRSKMKHGVSVVKEGLRYTLGIIFHDAR